MVYFEKMLPLIILFEFGHCLISNQSPLMICLVYLLRTHLVKVFVSSSLMFLTKERYTSRNNLRNSRKRVDHYSGLFSASNRSNASQNSNTAFASKCRLFL